ncbi:MAG: MerR family DNA-binding protein [Gammaproteobacteria bacterium]|nr:MerR family DNA-binding protein [Gammaproteobacteria bacterium]
MNKRTNEHPLTIGRLAARTEVNVETIRYYQRLGLIKTPRKPVIGHRTYPAETEARIYFIKRAKRLGFTLDEIQDLLEMGDGCCSDAKNKAIQKRDQIATHIQDLQGMMKTLNKLIEDCDSNPDPACPIILSLAGRK